MADMGNGPDRGGTGDGRAAGRRLLLGVLFCAGAVVLVGRGLLDVFDGGLERPLVSLVLVAALVATNLAPVVAVSSGRVSAFTPVGALLVPIGLLLPLGEAILVYAAGETIGVLLSHRFESAVVAPGEQRAVRTMFTVGKSIIGAAIGIVAMRAIPGVGEDPAAQVLAAFVGVVSSSAFDHVSVALAAAFVRGDRLRAELSRDLGDLLWIAAGEIVAGAVIAVLASRDPWSLVLGLAALGLLVVASVAYSRTAAEHAATRDLLALAERVHEADTVLSVYPLLLDAVRRMLPDDEVALRDQPPGPDRHGWRLSAPGYPDRWLELDRVVGTRDYEEQPLDVVDAAVSLAEVALTRAATQEQLLEQDRIRALVLSTVAHDLRTPLSTAGGSLETLARRADSLDDAARERLLGTARRAIGRLRRLMDDILGLDLVADRTADHGPVDVGRTVRELVAQLPLSTAVTLETDDHVTAAIDAVSLERIVENLILNASKYSPEGAAVTVRVEATADGGVLLVVEDEGPGVPEDTAEFIFEPFHTSGSGDRSGVGLGLYVARQFTDLHGGRIWVEDAAGRGAAFHVWLPATVAADAEV